MGCSSSDAVAEQRKENSKKAGSKKAEESPKKQVSYDKILVRATINPNSPSFKKSAAMKSIKKEQKKKNRYSAAS
jgi:hypothetical protein